MAGDPGDHGGRAGRQASPARQDGVPAPRAAGASRRSPAPLACLAAGSLLLPAGAAGGADVAAVDAGRLGLVCDGATDNAAALGAIAPPRRGRSWSSRRRRGRA